MICRSHRCLGVLLATCLFGCATGAPIYKDESLIIRLENNPKGTIQTDPDRKVLSTDKISAVLRGLAVRRKEGLLQYVIGGRQIESVFPEEQISLVSRELVNGLKQAMPDQRVAFQLWRTGPKGLRDETTGAMYLRGRFLSVGLDKFRVPARMSYEGAEGGSGKDFELLFDPAGALEETEKGFATRWLGGYRPELVIDLQRVAGSPDDMSGQPSASSPAVTSQEPSRGVGVTPAADADARAVDSLRQQVRELTETNQKLVKASSETQEEVARLRQELLETKLALADKELELKKLKSKSKGKTPPPAP